jgi:hypothetical protein
MFIHSVIQKIKNYPQLILLAVSGIPALIFYYLVARTVYNLPVYDDYSLIYFVNNFSQLDGWISKLNYIVNFQHNEYKLILVNLIFASQYMLFGHLDFVVLSMIGSASVIIIYMLLLNIFKITTNNLWIRYLSLLPVSLLLFQLQYASTINFSMASIQNISVLAFSLATVSFLAHNSKSRFAMACFSLLLAISASGNGFLLVPVGLLLLIERKRWMHIIIWITLSVLIMIVYFNQYSISHSSAGTEGGHLIKLLSQFNLIYVLAFIGASIAKYQNHFPSVLLGVFILCTWGFAFSSKYSMKNPSVFYFFIFLILTAFAVSTIRSGLGIEQSLSSRYRIYSNLILILTYIFLMETYFTKFSNIKVQLSLISVLIVFSLIFFIVSNSAGYQFLQGRKLAIAQEMTNWKSEVFQEKIKQDDQLEIHFDPAVTRQLELGIYKPVTPVLLESIRLGVYQPPTLSNK